MNTIERTINRWNECGDKSLKTFNLDNHYSWLFDGDCTYEDGYSFNLFINRIGRENLINSDDPEVEDLILKIDEEIYQTNKLLEKHILENFFMIDDFDMEKEEDWIEYRGKYSELKSELFQKFHNVKNSFLELDQKFPTKEKYDLSLQ